MAAFIPNWVASDSIGAAQQLMSAYTVGTIPNYPQGTEPSGMYVQGFDPSLGIGQFIYAQCSNAAGVTAGNVCEITQTLLSSGASVSIVNSVQQWQGTALSGKNLCVALATLTQNQYGWFQVYGAALVTSNGAIAAGNAGYWQANGVIQAGAVPSKQFVSAVAVVANSAAFGQGFQGVTPTLTATQSVYFISSPHAQAAIT